MYGELRTDIREIIKKLCEYKGVAIVEGSVCVDHVHLYVKIAPKLSVSEFMGYFYRKKDFIVRNIHNLWFCLYISKKFFP